MAADWETSMKSRIQGYLPVAAIWGLDSIKESPIVVDFTVKKAF